MKSLLAAAAVMAMGSGLSRAATAPNPTYGLWELPYLRTPKQSKRPSKSRKTVAQGKRDARKRRNRLRHKARAG